MEDYYNNNWDLDAVVRFACRLSSPPPPPPDPFSSLPPSVAVVKDEPFPDFSGGDGGQDADDLYKAFLAATPLPPPPPPPQTVAPRNQAPNQPSSPSKPQPSGRQASGSGSGRGTSSRSKRRKNQQNKVVCQVPADGASADMWAWRKYGQKPIKGSPYPRGYYRCSSSKGCMARKQVERSRTDPTTFVVTYTADHNHPLPTHRNSLAGTTRQKPASTTLAPPAEPSTANSPSTSLRSPSAEDDDEEGEDAGMLLVEDMEVVSEDELLFLKPEAPEMVDGGRKPTTLATVLFGVTDDPGEEEAAAAASGGS